MPQSTHDRTAELHNLAAHAHSAAATAHGKGDHLTAHEPHNRRRNTPGMPTGTLNNSLTTPRRRARSKATGESLVTSSQQRGETKPCGRSRVFLDSCLQ